MTDESTEQAEINNDQIVIDGDENKLIENDKEKNTGISDQF
jgi:hypothetical protein